MELYALVALNALVWLGVLVYTLRLAPPLSRHWHPAAAAVAVLVAAGISAGSYLQLQRVQAKREFQKYYFAGIDEFQRGNLLQAEEQFQRARALQPGNPDVEKRLEELRGQKPAEQREVRRETRVESVPALQPGGNTPPSNAPANAPAPAPSAPPQNAPQNAAAQNAPSGAPGEKPKPAPHKPSPFEITHYALDVEIDPAAHTVAATATIQVRSRGERVPALDFSLHPEFKPSEIRLNGTSVPFSHTNDLLSVRPRRALDRNAAATVTVRYRREGAAVIDSGDLIHPDGTYLRAESRWYPATGELDFRAPVRVRARVPKGFSVVSVGALKGTDKTDPKTTLFHWETDRFASMVSLAAAKYVQQSVQVPPPPGVTRAPLKVTCYTFPQHRKRAALFLKEAAAMTRFFERQFGPYPYEKLAVVEIPLFPGGYGTTSFVMLIDKSFEQAKLDREFLAHEIAHQWWGNSVFPQGLGAAWLTEAFANYSAWMYEAAVTGNPRLLNNRVRRATAEYFRETAREGDQAIYETDPYQPLGAWQEILYEKGAVVLHMLRRQIGDRAFTRTLRAFAEEYRFGKAKIPDFQKIAERESGQQLGWFFDQWLGRTGGMAFSYSFDTEPATATHNRAVLRVTQPSPAYRGKMRVVLAVENTVQTKEIDLTGEPAQTFTFPVQGRLTNVLFDPDGVYLKKPPKWVVPDRKS